MNREVFITSTALTEKETRELLHTLRVQYAGVKYVQKMEKEVSVLVINKKDPLKHWMRTKKLIYAAAYRPEIHVIDLGDVLMSTKPDADIKTIPQIKPFEGLHISLCRLEEGLLEKVKHVIEANGGIAIAHLTNDTDVMISMIADGKRYEAALKWGIPVVSPDWCYDSADRGLPLNTSCYKLLKDMTGMITRLNFENDEDRTGVETVVKTYNLGRRDEACDWEKLKEWRENERNRKLEEYIKHKMNKENKSDDEESDTIFDDNFDDSVLEKKKRSLDNEDQFDDKIVKVKKTGKSDELWNSIMNKDKKTHSVLTKTKPFQVRVKQEKGPILNGLTFQTIGYNPTEDAKIRKVITKFGGKFVDAGAEMYTVVSFNYNKPVFGDNLITEMAIERFIYNEKVDNSDYLWCKPFALPEDLTIKEFREKFIDIKTENTDKVKVAITGFDGTDLSQMERLLKDKLGKCIDFRQTFTQDCELLVIGLSGHTNTGRQRKQQMARIWNVQVLLVEDFYSKVLEFSM